MTRTLVALVCLFVAVPAVGQEVRCDDSNCGPVVVPNASIDPKFRLLQSALESRGGAHPIFGPSGAVGVNVSGVAATLRMHRPLDPLEAKHWKGEGVRWLRNETGDLVEVGLVYGAWVPFELVPRLDELPLVRAEVAWQPVSLAPLADTTRQIGASRVLHRPDGFDGSGTLIVDIDSFVDVLHPHFFRADAGRFVWIDADGNGAFSQGDGVDLDGDGKVDSREILRVLDAVEVSFRGDGSIDGDDLALSIGRDWLYADLNGDNERNAGVAAGFTEEDPAYGEPVFVVDDVDRDGVLEVGEPLLMLGTSKIRKVVSGERSWIRGVDLIEAADADAARSSLHGTAVNSALLGGQPGYMADVGVAPGAEVVVYSVRDDTTATLQDVPQLRALDDAAQLGADIVLHEWTNPYSAQHDGSTNLNVAMDAARASGIVQVTPVGNMNQSGKHLQVGVSPGPVVPNAFRVPADGYTARSGELLPYSTVYLSLFWREAEQPTVVLESPSGASVELVADGQERSIEPGVSFIAAFERSQRGTAHLFVTLFTDDGETLPDGEWGVDVQTAGALNLWGRVADFHSGWDVGVAWVSPTEGAGTVVYPSTADSAWAVGAYAGVVAGAQDVGELRGFSGRGPRIDGAPVLDITAPDDPVIALAGVERFLEIGFGRSWFVRFGGTSGAAPHVAGTFALLRQQDPSATARELEEIMAASADSADLVPSVAAFPDSGWGWGRLDSHSAIFGAPAEPNENPVADLRIDGESLDASASSDPDGDMLEFRFDVDNDGTWETEWTEVATLAAVPAAGERARVQVRDPSGATSGALVLRAPESGADAGPDAGGDAGAPDPREPGRGCCSVARDGQIPGAFVWLLFALAAALAIRRDRLAAL